MINDGYQPEMFSSEADPMQNLLPYDGTVNYYGAMLDAAAAQFYFSVLFDTAAWQNDVVLMYGKQITTKRKIAWYADDALDYSYSGVRKTAHVWTPELLELRREVEAVTDHRFNSCLLNLYHDGSEGMGYHSDDEGDLLKESAIASLTLGATRKFVFKHKRTKQKVEIYLQSGSLLVMKGETQQHWQHSLPATTKVAAPRINLTFRSRVPRNEP
jgi:alkylated DNA repair dioxygenase AlkB